MISEKALARISRGDLVPCLNGHVPEELMCPHCHRRFDGAQYHAGFSDLGFLYCDQDGSLLTWSSYSPVYSAIVDKHPWMLDEEESRQVEDALLPCPRGGRFRFGSPPRCPYCNKDLSSLLKDPIHFLAYGERLDADKDQLWRDREKVEPR